MAGIRSVNVIATDGNVSNYFLASWTPSSPRVVTNMRQPCITLPNYGELLFIIRLLTTCLFTLYLDPQNGECTIHYSSLELQYHQHQQYHIFYCQSLSYQSGMEICYRFLLATKYVILLQANMKMMAAHVRHVYNAAHAKMCSVCVCVFITVASKVCDSECLVILVVICMLNITAWQWQSYIYIQLWTDHMLSTKPLLFLLQKYLLVELARNLY